MRSRAAALGLLAAAAGGCQMMVGIESTEQSALDSGGGGSDVDGATIDAAGSGGAAGNPGTGGTAGTGGGSGTGGQGGVSPEGGPCSNGETSCVDANLMLCKGGAWEKQRTCVFVCENNDCRGVCSPGRSECINGKSRGCDTHGQWKTPVDCANGCKDGVCLGCASGTFRCDSLTPMVCAPDGTWKQNGQACTENCDSATGQCVGKCAANTMRCNAAVVQRCSADGTWQDSIDCGTQGMSCHNNACVEKCQAPAQRCINNAVEKCDPASGAWTKGDDCTAMNKSCVDGQCTDKCQVNSQRCNNNQVQKCDTTGAWVTSDDCGAYGKTCLNGQCTTKCQQNTHQCNANLPMVCDAQGNWVQSGPACQQTCDPALGMCTSPGCMEGAVSCGDSRNQLTCVSGMWKNPVQCSNACVDGYCQGACIPGSRSCEMDSPRLCDSTGNWQPWGPPCPDGCDPAIGQCTGPCSVGTQQCGDAVTLLICEATNTWKPKDCPFACVGSSCGGNCKPGTTQCYGSTLSRCNDAGQWSSSPCVGVCQNNQCIGCPEGQLRCNGNTVETCSSGTWGVTDTCQLGPCKNNACSGCISGDRRCTNTMLEYCDSNGTWQFETQCPGACYNNQCVGGCVPDTYQCANLYDLQICNYQGTWQTDQSCLLCQNNACVGCVQDARRCDGPNFPQTCSNGEWQTVGDCQPAGQTCFGGECMPHQPSCPPSTANRCGLGSSQDCCATYAVYPGQFYRGYDGVGFPDTSAPAQVGNVPIDLYEVNVGRFRVFVENAGWTLLTGGEGMHPTIPDSGWDPAWNGFLSPDIRANLNACPGHTWSDDPSANNSLPINCLNWYEAFAFCAWDGGRLLTATEWNYTASGGDEQRCYPWSVSGECSVDHSRAAYDFDSVAPVGSLSAGAGRWFHLDLAGNVAEWVLDNWTDGTYPMPCNNCAFLNPTASYREVRGGGTSYNAQGVLANARYRFLATDRTADIGFRCARLFSF